MMMKGRSSKNVQSKRSAKNGRRDQKQQVNVVAKRSQEQEKRKASDHAKEDLSTVSVVSDSTTQSESCEVYETVDLHYVDDNGSANGGSSDAHQESDSGIVAERRAKEDSPSRDLEKDEEEEEDDDDEENVKTASEGTNANGMAEEAKDVDVWEDASNGALSAGSENELPDGRGGREGEELKQKIKALETRMEKLEEELREVAALEISLYSVVPDHSSSAHKLHTPARRLSRLYIHSCKHWTQRNRASIARNTVSGLILVAKSCGNDVSRLTFWLSNTIALREIISHAFGRSLVSTKISDSNGKPASQKWRKSSGTKPSNGFNQLFEDWQDTETFIAALEKVESWVFSRIVESVWWQVFTPHMQSPEADVSAGKTNGKLMGPSLGDEQQGNFSISLWKNAFEDALRRLCPIRGSGHECGCLSVLARLVMEQCIARFDVAMFNAILRESEHQIPTDPVSDPILDSKVLPVPAGDLSFGSGAQLKNAVGNWSRCLTELFGLNSDDSVEEENRDSKDGKPFLLLNELSDLLMLPKDMLMDRSIREEVCPSIGLPLIKRILCNFTPDEFCPDHVPGAVLEELNAESFAGQKSSRGFPYAASPVFYMAPSSVDVAEKVAEAGDASKLSRNVSVIQRKGYTSDEELEEMDSPLTSVIDKVSNGNVKNTENVVGSVATNSRYDLLREVWST